MRSVQILMLLLFGILLTSCGARKSASKEFVEEKTSGEKVVENDPAKYEYIEDEPEHAVLSSVLQTAEGFLGTSYRYGGTTNEGMDCSGLVYTSFLAQDISLPRSSKDMALLGEELHLKDVNLGDLLFFITDRRKKAINHVGLVVDLDEENIYFIHSTTSRGVVISTLADYWQEHFVMARRIQ